MTPRDEVLRRLAADARRALSGVRPELAWGDPEADHEVRGADGREVTRIGACRAEGVRLRAADEEACIDALNAVITPHGFPDRPASGGSEWGELVLSSRRQLDGARFEWRGGRGVRLWIDVPAD